MVNQNCKTINAEAFRRLQSINNGRRIFVNNGNIISKSLPIIKQNKVVSDSISDESDSVYPRLNLTSKCSKKLLIMPIFNLMFCQL